MKFKFLIYSLLSVGAPIAGFGAEPSNAPLNVLRVDDVVTEVLRHNRDLKSRRATLEAMKERVPQERAWADPKAGVDIERSGTTRFDTFTDNEWMLSQEIPISGKNRLSGEAALADANAYHGNVHQRELELSTLARISFYRYANAFALIEINHKSQSLLKQFADASHDKYRLGLRSQADVLMAETELAKNGETLRDLEQQASEEQSRLNVLMNRHPQTSLGKPEVSLRQFPAIELAQLETMALRHRPELESAQFKIKAARARQSLAKRRWIPDPELRVEARQFNGASRVISEYDTGIFFNIPWVNRGKYKAGEREAQKVRESAELELASLELETLAMVRDQLSKIQTAHHHLGLFEEKIIPLGRQTIEATLTAYTNEKATLLELLSAEKSLRESESMLQQERTAYLTALSEMENLTGPLQAKK
ncbi:MAG TPA: TolC family protein [Candidatus Saccharimonadales bacterium]|nr:TolC family protein [Candidatus Saccharimonadales bacterium]